MQKNIHEFIKKIPKSDLHVHLDGSVRVDTLIDLSKQQHLQLPSYTVEGLNELVFKDNYANLVEYLTGFGYVLPVMQTAENLERISYEFALDNIAEGVCYVEVRFAPQLHINDNLDMEQILLSVNRGLNRAKIEYNQKPKIKSGQLPEFNYGIIVCAMRFFAPGFSKFYDTFLEAHKYSKLNCIYGMAAYELVAGCIKIRDQHHLPIVALDLAGGEAGNPPIHQQAAYHLAHQHLMHLIVHAGEAWGPESIFQAITEIYAERIGHGTQLFFSDKIIDPRIQDKEAYVKRLAQYLAENRITLEVCLTSNLQTLPFIKTIKDHPFAQMLAAHLSTAICTDNRTFSKTSVTKELTLAVQNFNLDKAALKDLIAYSFKRSFYPGSYLEKRKYVQQVLARYETLANEPSA